MSQVTPDQTVHIAEDSIVTVADNIEAVKTTSANMTPIKDVWAAMSAVKLAPESAAQAEASAQAAAISAKEAERFKNETSEIANIGFATTERAGLVKPDGITTQTDAFGVLSVPVYDGATAGLVPTASAGEQEKVLSGAGAWIDMQAGAGGATTLVLDADLELTKDSPKKMNVSTAVPGLRIRLPQPADLEEDGVSFVVVNSGSEGIQVIDAFGNPLGADAGFIRNGQARAFVLVSTQAGLWAVLNLASATVGGGYDQGLTIEKGAPVVFASTSTTDGSSTLLSDNKILATYTDSTNNYLGMAVVITIFGSNITVGEPVVFNNAKTYEKAVLTLSPDKALVAYYSEGSTSLAGCNALVLNVTGTTISLGPKYKLSSSGGSTYKISCIAVSSGSVLIIYTGANNAYGQMALLSITESSISSVSTGKLSGLYTSYAEIVRLNADKFVIIYNNNSASNVGSICPLTIDAENQSIILGNTVDIFKESISHVSAIALSSDKILVAYYSNSTKGTAVVLTISDTDIVVGNPVTFDDKGVSQISLVFLSENKALVAYNSNSTGKATLLTIYGTTINIGNTIVFTGGSTNYISGFALSSDKAVVTYSDNANGAYGTSIILSFEGKTLTALPPVVFSTNAIWNGMPSFSATSITPNSVVVAYANGSSTTSTTAYIQVISVSGTEISVGEPLSLASTSSYYFTGRSFYLSTISSNKVMLLLDQTRSSSSSMHSYNAIFFTVTGLIVVKNGSYIGVNKYINKSCPIATSENNAYIINIAGSSNPLDLYIYGIDASTLNLVHSEAIGTGFSNWSDSFLSLLSPDKLLFVGNKDERAVALTLSVSGATVSAGPIVNINGRETQQVNAIQVAVLSPNKVLVVYQVIGISGAAPIEAVVLSISGLTVTAGDPVILGDTSIMETRSLVALSTNKAALVYRNNTENARGEVLLLSIEGTNINKINTTIFNTGPVSLYYSSHALSNGSKILAFYADNRNSYYNTASLILRR